MWREYRDVILERFAEMEINGDTVEIPGILCRSIQVIEGSAEGFVIPTEKEGTRKEGNVLIQTFNHLQVQNRLFRMEDDGLRESLNTNKKAVFNSPKSREKPLPWTRSGIRMKKGFMLKILTRLKRVFNRRL